ncbi:6251_t:CDS:2, partial [Dentiscutata heterogama]
MKQVSKISKKLNLKYLKQNVTRKQISKKKIPVGVRERIIQLRELNFSTREIGIKFGIGSSIVSKTSKREEETGEVKDRERSGRPRILSPDDVKDILDILSSEKGSTAVKIHSMYVAKTGKYISVETIRNILKREYINWTPDNWKKVIFSDESKFVLFWSNFRKFCWRKKGDKLERAYVNQTKKFGGGSIMVWSCITSHGVGEICRIETHLDNEAADTKDWINQRNINTLKWPPYSPDLSPIENVWSEVKRCLEERLEEQQQEPAMKSEKLNKLWKMVEEEWKKIDINYIISLYDSMPCRMAAVIAND